MAMRDREFWQLEYALYALAKYKRTQDTALIREKLYNNYHQMSYSFRILKEYPNEHYWDVLNRYYKYRLNDEICENGYYSKYSDFVDVVAFYKQPRSAEILLQIWNNTPKFRCVGHMEYIRLQIAEAIRRHRAPVYTELIQQSQYVFSPDND